MEDAKLEELAADYTELTDLARKALNEEIERRGLRARAKINVHNQL
jgi:hypothetical protein